MAWLPLNPAQLRIGLFIKVDHNWVEHPFVRNTFFISSQTEIAIIEKHRLTNLFYDPDRSHADALVALMHTGAQVSGEPDEGFVQDIVAAEKALHQEKAVHIKKVIDHRKALDEAERDYADTKKRCSVMMAMASAGQAEGVQLAMQMATSMLELLEQPSVALSLVQSMDLDDPEQELALQAMNVSALAALTGKIMSLNHAQLQHVALAGLFHNVGQHRFPPAFRAKETDRFSSEMKFVQMYPQMGKQILEALPGMPPKVVEVVYQHREYLDGTGYPRGLVNGDIGQLSRVVGTIVEYHQLLSNGNRGQNLSPTQALSHLYVNMKPKLGSDVVEPFIATMTVYPPGSFVEMSDDTIGVVVQTNVHERMRPVIMLYDPASSHREAAVIDLTRERTLLIRKSLNPTAVPPRVMEMLRPSKVVGYHLTVR